MGFIWEDNPPKPTSPTGYQKPNNEMKSQIYPYVNIKSQKNLRDFDDYAMDVDTRKDIDDEMGYDNDID